MQRAVIALAGLGFVAVGYYVYSDSSFFGAGAEETTGTVVRVLWGTSSGMHFSERSRKPVGGDYIAKLEVRYHAGGGTHTFTTRTASRSLGRYDPGDTVTVLYDPERPNEGRMAGGAGSMLGIVLMACGALAVAGGLFGSTMHARPPGPGGSQPPPGYS